MSTVETRDLLRELESVLGGLTGEMLDGAIGKINAHERLFFYGAGRSGLMIRALCMRLMQMGREAWAVGETSTPAIGKGDLLCLASASGKTESVLRYAQKAVSVGAELLVITANTASPLTDVAPADILLKMPEKTHQLLGSLFEQALLATGDILTRRMGPDEEAMRARHANLE